MEIMEIIARVKREPGEKNYSCYMRIDSINAGVLGQGSSARAAMEDMLSGWNELKADLEKDGKKIADIEISYTFDTGVLFSQLRP